MVKCRNHHKKFKYPIGYRFNSLTIIGYLGAIDSNNHTCYLCKCDCGNIRKIMVHNLQRQKSCGCLPRGKREL